MSAFRRYPAVRVGVRAVVVAALTYVAPALVAGFTDWRAFALGLGGAISYAVLGVLTPVEPLVGVKAKVEP